MRSFPSFISLFTITSFLVGCDLCEQYQLCVPPPVNDQEMVVEPAPEPEIVVCTWDAPPECEAACAQIDSHHGDVCVLVDGVAQAWPDRDSDGYPDATDTCPYGWNHDQSADYDHDGRLDGCDNCITIANADQSDLNGNRVGDVCEYLGEDNDGDCYCEGLPRAGGMPTCLSNPACPQMLGIADCDDTNPNANWWDDNGECTVDQGDPDQDGVLSHEDNCPDVANPDQLDRDADGIGAACEEVAVFTWTRGEVELPELTQMVSLSATCIDDVDGWLQFKFDVDSASYGRDVEQIELSIPYGDYTVDFCFVTLIENEAEGARNLPPGEATYTDKGETYDAPVTVADANFVGSWLVDLSTNRIY